MPVVDLVPLDSQSVQITLSQPVRAVAAGQSVVFYDMEGHLLGGGIIS